MTTAGASQELRVIRFYALQKYYRYNLDIINIRVIFSILCMDSVNVQWFKDDAIQKAYLQKEEKEKLPAIYSQFVNNYY